MQLLHTVHDDNAYAQCALTYVLDDLWVALNPHLELLESQSVPHGIKLHYIELHCIAVQNRVR